MSGTRIPVATIVGLVANGLTTDEITAEYPQLTLADVQACLGYAARAVDGRELPVRAHCVRFLIDECLPPSMAGLLRASGHDCAHAYELGLGGQPDEQIMAR